MSQAYRVQIFLGLGDTGPSEQYISRPVATPTELASVVNGLMNVRQGCLPTLARISGVRISPYGQVRQSQLFLPPGGLIGGIIGNQVTFAANGNYSPAIEGADQVIPDQARVVLETQLFYGGPTPATRYLFGLPIGAVQAEPGTLNLNYTPAWYSRVRAFYGVLVSAGWQVQNQLTPTPPTYYRIGALQMGPQTPPLLGLVCPTAGGVPALTVGQRIFVQQIRPAKFTRQPTLNGSWAVYSIDTTSTPGAFIVYLQGSSAINPATNRTTMKSVFRLPNYQLAPITGYNLQRGAIHKRGKPGLAPRGRRLSRPTLDP